MDFSKPRVAVYYHVLASTGMRNDGGPLFINWNLRKILNNCKTFEETKANMADISGNVVHLFPGVAQDMLGTFDLNILVDYGEDALGIPLDWELPHPNAYWVSDAHLDKGYRLERARQFDFVFVAQKRAYDEFYNAGIDPRKLFWLPHAVETDVYKPYDIIEKWDWSFIGHMNGLDRIALIDHLTKALPNWYVGWRNPGAPGFNVLDDVARKFSMSRVVVNENVKDDINLRTFEAMACQRPLVTEAIPHLDALFQDKVHLRTYRSIEEAESVIRELLVDEEQRRALAEAGYKEVLDKHTFHHRALTILETCLNYKPQGELIKC